MENISDQTGRAFEFAIVDELSKQAGITLTSRARDAQIRDEPKFASLDHRRSEEFRQASRTIAKTFLSAPFYIGTATVDRLADNEAVGGDVTDIRISPLDKRPPINLSIKNNHHALKHQRPSSLMQQLGILKHSPLDMDYRNRLRSVFDSFGIAAKRLRPNATSFGQLKQADVDFVNRELYAPVCALVSATLARYLADERSCQAYFRFLVGNTDYIKIVLRSGYLEFIDFSQLRMPSSCEVKFTPSAPSYIFLAFDNGWKMSLRLHIADSRLGTQGEPASTKFDTQPIDMPLDTFLIPLQ